MNLTNFQPIAYVIGLALVIGMQKLKEKNEVKAM